MTPSTITRLNSCKNSLNQAWQHAVAGGAYREADLITVAYRQVAQALSREATTYERMPYPPEIVEPVKPWERGVGVSN